ncbi:hypothetical protein LTS01_025858, partial [Friedmanniomyces endolithicus]
CMEHSTPTVVSLDVHSRIASYVAVIRAHESMTDGMKRKTCQANANPMLPSAASQNEIAVLGSSQSHTRLETC